MKCKSVLKQCFRVRHQLPFNHKELLAPLTPSSPPLPGQADVLCRGWRFSYFFPESVHQWDSSNIIHQIELEPVIFSMLLLKQPTLDTAHHFKVNKFNPAGL